jgi:hypothetical protein
VVHFKQGIDMSLGGGQTQTPVADSNKYAQIMELMRRRNAMNNSTYTGGFNPYGSLASSTPQNTYDELARLQAVADANRRVGPQGGSELGVNPFGGLSAAQQAGYYAENPIMGKVTQTLQDIFGYTTLGALQKALDPTFVSNQSLIARGIDPSNLGYLGGILGSSTTAPTAAELSNPLSGGWGARDAGGGTTGSGFSGSGALSGSSTSADIGAVNSADVGGWGGRDAGGGTGGGQSPAGGGDGGRDAGGNTGSGGGSPAGGGDGGRDAGGNTGSDGGSPAGGGDGGRDAGGIGYYKGGKVTMNRLQGPNPMGPDDGYGALKDGEFVMNPNSVSKYGIDLMNAINNGKISKGKLRGLLEG